MKIHPTAWLTRVVAIVVVLSGHAVQGTRNIGKTCPCKQEKARLQRSDDLGDDSFVLGTSTSVSCCKDILLGYHDPGASIQWLFNDEDYSKAWKSSLHPRYCGDETIQSTSGRATDTGNYTCTVIASNGTSTTVSMKLTMEKKDDHREKPVALKTSADVLAKVGANVSFSCEGYVGVHNANSYDASVTWVKYHLNNSSPVFANWLPNVNVTQVFGSGGSAGMLRGQLVISPVQELHFGVYQCTLRNKYEAESFNMSLTEGVPVGQAMVLRYKTTVTALAALLGLLVVLVMMWCRYGRLFALHCRIKLASKCNHPYDVFLVHGDSVSRWVWSVLLPSLEDSYGYKCFLPQRDMCGGDMMAESIVEALSRCRRVVVVVTPCLMDSPWATWATYGGIQSALTSRARILGLAHKEKSFVNDPLENNPLVSVLKVVRKIWVPEELVWDTWEGSASLQYCCVPATQTVGHKPELKLDIRKTELKLIIPDIIINNSISSSPSNQRLSNMITGSNAASKEDLGSEKDNKANVSCSVVFTGEDHQLQDPGSPNSVTPFIIPSKHDGCRSSSDSLMCKPLGRCLQVVCVGNPEEKFWQTLRLHLGPPSLSRGGKNAQ